MTLTPAPQGPEGDVEAAARYLSAKLAGTTAHDRLSTLLAALSAEKEAHAETRAHNAMWARKYADLMALWERDRTALDGVDRKLRAAEAARDAALADVERLREALKAMLAHGWWDGYDDNGNNIIVCPCEGSPPCIVVQAAAAALATTPKEDGP